MGIIKKAIPGLKPGSDYLFTLKPKNVEIAASDSEQDTIRVNIPAFTGTPSLITGLEIASSFQTVIFKFDPINDPDLAYYEYQLYDNALGNGSPINARTSSSNDSSTLVSGTNVANVFLVDVPNTTQTVNINNNQTTTETKAYWGRVRAVNTSGNFSTAWTSLVASGSLALIEDQFIANLTAAKITSGTISAHTITLSGANSVIKSSTYNGTYNSGTNQWTTGSSGWLISGNGQAIFDASQIRGAVAAGSININTHNYWAPSLSTAVFKVGSDNNYLYFNGATLELTGTIYASAGSIGGWIINSSGIASNNYNVTLSSNGTFTIGSDANDRAVITSNGDFTVVGYDSSQSSYGVSNFYGPWFKIVKGNDIGADQPQAQFTWRDLILSDNKGTNNVYTDFIALSNPSSGLSNLRIVVGGIDKLLIDKDTVYAPDAFASFKFLGVSGTIFAGGSTALLKVADVTQTYTNIGGYDSNGNATYTLIDGRSFSTVVPFPKTDIWMHYAGPAGGPNNWGYSNAESWTAVLLANWDTSVPGYPNPYTIWGITRDGWKAYIQQYYTGNSYSSRTITGASDLRVKDNIQPINSVINPLNIVNEIEPKIYDYLHYRTKKLDENGQATDEWNPTPKKFGFIAQDLIEKLGEYKDLVTDEVNDPNYDFPLYTTEDRGIIAILWGAVRELSNQVNDLQQQISS